jgi:hypothetical protein
MNLKIFIYVDNINFFQPFSSRLFMVSEMTNNIVTPELFNKTYKNDLKIVNCPSNKLRNTCFNDTIPDIAVQRLGQKFTNLKTSKFLNPVIPN